MSLRGMFRDTALGACRTAGLFSASADSPGRRERLLILCYHGVSLDDEDQWRPRLFIRPDQFRKRLQTLRSAGANVLPLREALERLATHSLPPRSVAITFDDGFYDFYRHAFPLLREFGYPCTVYLTTYYCRHSRPVFMLMADYLLWKSGLEKVRLSEAGLPDPVTIGDETQRQKLVRRLVSQAAECNPDRAEEAFARQIAAAGKLNYDDILVSRKLQLMNPQEAAEVSRAGIALELHTHRHRTPRERGLFIREIRDNAVCIQEITGLSPAHFCYPSGDYDSMFLPWLRETGILSATTCVNGLADPKAEPLLLPRMLDDSLISQVQFERWLSGFGC